MPIISVIMPAYNVERYVHRSIGSVLSQTLRDFELLIVDDGSTDNTASICDEYAKKDSRVKVFHKENGGVASARQVGLENVTGDYCIHFDADDYADSRMLEDMYRTAIETGADIVISDFNIITPEGSTYLYRQKIRENSSDVLIDILTGKVFGALWHKLIKSSLFIEKKIDFTIGVDYCEDVLIDAKLMKDGDVKVVHQNGVYYTYCRENADSITRNYDKSKFDTRMKFFNELQKMLNEDKYKYALESEAWDIKMEAYSNGLIGLKDFDSIYPGSLRFLRFVRAPKMIRVKLIAYSMLHKIESTFTTRKKCS